MARGRIVVRVGINNAQLFNSTADQWLIYNQGMKYSHYQRENSIEVVVSLQRFEKQLQCLHVNYLRNYQLLSRRTHLVTG